MGKRGWSARVVIRYTLFQIPAVAVLICLLFLAQRWVNLPGWFVWGLVALWLAKDVILFPFAWRAYDRERRQDESLMIGARGVASDRLAPSGYIQVRGELWRAEATAGGSPIDKGEAVRVREIRGLTLIVEREGGESTG
jgi:membrane protein implicated in regulation of membrane protease activity